MAADQGSFDVECHRHVDVEAIMLINIKIDTALMRDEANHYAGVGLNIASHDVENHNKQQYVRGVVTTNIVEGFYSIFKRGMKGVYQHCSEKHLQRYLAEFDFLYSV